MRKLKLRELWPLPCSGELIYSPDWWAGCSWLPSHHRSSRAQSQAGSSQPCLLPRHDSLPKEQTGQVMAVFGGVFAGHWVLFLEVEIDSGGREVEKAGAIAAMLWQWGYFEDESLLLRVKEENRCWVQLVWSHYTKSHQLTCTLVFQEEKCIAVLLKSVILGHSY